MRVKRYISVLLVGSVLGAFALPALVGFSLRAQQGAMRVSARASHDFRSVESLSRASRELLAVFDILTTEQSGVVLVAQRAADQCRAILAELGASESFAASPILIELVDTFERMVAAGERASVLDESASGKQDQLHRFDAASMAYLTSLAAIERKAAALVEQQVQSLMERSSRDREIILGCGVLFLCGVFVLRWWITARLVRPLDALAHAATESMSNGQDFVLEETGPSEIRTLTRTVKSFIGSLEREIGRRTRDLECTNLELAGQKEEAEAMNTELTSANAAMEAARVEATLATRAKSEFLANMSHEIRTPMTAILGFAENMLDTDLSDSEKLNCVHTIRRNGEYLLGLINDILDLSKIEADKMTIERKGCQPCQIIAEVASLMRVRASAKGLPFNIEYIGASPETIRSDATRLRQILINLIGNAIKFTETGAVRLVTRFVDDGDEPYMQFDVIDTGCGMTEEQKAKLFQPFMQADTSTTRKFGGTGLGLTISKRFAELLGGDITVAVTEMGLGSTFRATVTTGPLDGVKMLEDPLSATVVADTASTIARISPSDLQGCRILLAEDGPDNQRLISFVLKKAGAEVTTADNGKLALDAALAAGNEGNPFDTILMDMQMPVMDGYEATGMLRQKGYTGPIIALTAHAMAGDREKCIQAGCDHYATKPIDRKKLIGLIRTHKQPATALLTST